MKKHCKNNLNDLRELLEKLNQDDYISPCEFLSGASIGQHFRHILELYNCLINGLEKGSICYDDRKRDILLETCKDFAIETINEIDGNIEKMEDKQLTLIGNYSLVESNNNIQTSVFRELAYNLEHSIHHQALIKVGVKELGKIHLITETFGVAASTIRFKNIVSN